MMNRLDKIATTAFSKDRLPQGIAPPKLDVLHKKLEESPESLLRVLDYSLEWNTREVGGKELHPSDFVDEPKAPVQVIEV